MSRGLGRVERIIAKTFADNPDGAYIAEDLACLAYPDEQRPNGITTAQLVSVLRAARKVAKRTGWRRSLLVKHIVYYNPASNASGWRRQVLEGRRVSPEQVEAILADPSRWSVMMHLTRLAELENDPASDPGEVEAQKAWVIRAMDAIGFKG